MAGASAGHHHKKKRSAGDILLLTVYWMGVIVAAFVLLRFLIIPFLQDMGRPPGTPAARYAASKGMLAAIATHGSYRSGRIAPAPFTNENRGLTSIPPQDAEWPAWIEVPFGYRIESCEANERRECTDTESDVTKIRYAYQCRNTAGNAEDWSPDTCKAYSAVRMRALGTSPLQIAYWFSRL